MGSEIRIRPAAEEDLETVRSIFNYYVETSMCTFNLEPQTQEECLASFRARTDKLPWSLPNSMAGLSVGPPFPSGGDPGPPTAGRLKDPSTLEE